MTSFCLLYALMGGGLTSVRVSMETKYLDHQSSMLSSSSSSSRSSPPFFLFFFLPFPSSS